MQGGATLRNRAPQFAEIAWTAGQVSQPILPIAYSVGSHPNLSDPCGAIYSTQFSAHHKELTSPMLTSCQYIQNLDNLREYVNRTLCHHDQLEIDAFRMTERILVRSGKPCGILFCLHGPRSVKPDRSKRAKHQPLVGELGVSFS